MGRLSFKSLGKARFLSITRFCEPESTERASWTSGFGAYHTHPPHDLLRCFIRNVDSADSANMLEAISDGDIRLGESVLLTEFNAQLSVKRYVSVGSHRITATRGSGMTFTAAQILC